MACAGARAGSGGSEIGGCWCPGRTLEVLVGVEAPSRPSTPAVLDPSH